MSEWSCFLLTSRGEPGLAQGTRFRPRLDANADVRELLLPSHDAASPRGILLPACLAALAVQVAVDGVAAQVEEAVVDSDLAYAEYHLSLARPGGRRDPVRALMNGSGHT